MGLRITTEATVEPVTLAEQYLFMHVVSDTTDDAMVTAMIKAVRKAAEVKCHRSFAEETYLLTLDTFPTGGIKLPMPPLSLDPAAVSISYVDENETTQSMPAADFVIDAESEPAWVFPSTEQATWPTTANVVNAVSVTYTTATRALTENVKLWIKIRVATMYAYREAYLEGRTAAIELGRDYIDGLLDSVRLIEI